nr:hypothetical protein CJLB15_00005 [Campylobacter phage CJLB-15]
MLDNIIIYLVFYPRSITMGINVVFITCSNFTRYNLIRL